METVLHLDQEGVELLSPSCATKLKGPNGHCILGLVGASFPEKFAHYHFRVRHAGDSFQIMPGSIVINLDIISLPL